MKASFINFSRRNRAAAKLAILSQLEYRINFLIDAVLQPLASGGIEVALWSGILSGMGRDTLGGFGREFYLAYALWGTFMGRVSANWSYEFTMLEDIDSGRINAILTRPISFYEFYLFQFLGYKSLVMVSSLAFPVVFCWLLGLPFQPARIPAALALVSLYLVFTHTLSFIVASLAFHMNRAQSLTSIKNLALWVLAGETVPLDLYPEPLRSWLLSSPFAAGVYVPVSFITGRVGPEALTRAFWSVAVCGVIVGAVSSVTWRWGVRSYAGTGA